MSTHNGRWIRLDKLVTIFFINKKKGSNYEEF